MEQTVLMIIAAISTLLVVYLSDRACDMHLNGFFGRVIVAYMLLSVSMGISVSVIVILFPT